MQWNIFHCCARFKQTVSVNNNSNVKTIWISFPQRACLISEVLETAELYCQEISWHMISQSLELSCIVNDTFRNEENRLYFIISAVSGFFSPHTVFFGVG